MESSEMTKTDEPIRIELSGDKDKADERVVGLSEQPSEPSDGFQKVAEANSKAMETLLRATTTIHG
jgi:hypothetical protein